MKWVKRVCVVVVAVVLACLGADMAALDCCLNGIDGDDGD